MGRNRRLILLALAASALLPAQSPQLVWEGVVDGAVVLSIRGNRVQVENRGGRPVERPRYRFFERLPEARLDARVEVREGRGYVHIIQQPRLENEYTLLASIEDRQEGAALYSVAFYWDNSRGQAGAATDRLVWSGSVEREALVTCRRDACRSEALNGGVTGERFHFSNPLPARAVAVSLEGVEGRGDIRLIGQPRDENGYAARVSIRIPDAGAGSSGFTLAWARPVREETDFALRGLVWSGRVSGRVRLAVAGRKAASEGPVEAERATFFEDLPARENSFATVKRLRGRCRAEVAEYPSRRNDYRLIIEIDGRADPCEIEVSW